jgi:hypothetical protein
MIPIAYTRTWRTCRRSSANCVYVVVSSVFYSAAGARRKLVRVREVRTMVSSPGGGDT